MKNPSRAMRIGAAGAIAASLLLTGCSAGSSDGPVTIEYWGWVPGMQGLVDEWNAENPDIQVEYSAQSAGDSATFQKITTAAQAGNAPDLVQADTRWVTSLIEYAADVTDEAAQYEDAFTPGAWSTVSIGGSTYGLPQDSGPMVMYYNAALYEQYGLEVPTTWDEYAATAATLTAANPGVYLGGFSADEVETLESYVQQAGGQWWTIDDGAWNVDVTSDASLQVADFWQGLVDEDLVSPTMRWDPTFYNDLAEGRILSVVGAGWQAPLIADNAASTSGDWAVAPMPQWEEGAEVSANNGGSQLLVLDGTDHAPEALEFAAWLNTNVDGLLDLGLFPATAEGDFETPQALSDFYGGADVYAALSTASQQVETPWVFPPTYATTAIPLGDGIAAVRAGTTTLPELFESLQAQSLTDFESAGIAAQPAP